MQIVLSRRNLYSLLHKLEMEGSARTIVKNIEEDGSPLLVRVMEDDEYYGSRRPGQMHPETEKFIKYMEEVIRERRGLE